MNYEVTENDINVTEPESLTVGQLNTVVRTLRKKLYQERIGRQEEKQRFVIHMATLCRGMEVLRDNHGQYVIYTGVIEHFE